MFKDIKLGPREEGGARESSASISRSCRSLSKSSSDNNGVLSYPLFGPSKDNLTCEEF